MPSLKRKCVETVSLRKSIKRFCVPASTRPINSSAVRLQLEANSATSRRARFRLQMKMKIVES